MEVILLILILLTCVSLLVRNNILTTITCAVLLGSLIARDFSIEARVRNDYYATVSSNTEGKVSPDFYRGVRAVVMYVQDTRSILYVSAALILLLQIVTKKGRTKNVKKQPNRIHSIADSTHSE